MNYTKWTKILFLKAVLIYGTAAGRQAAAVSNTAINLLTEARQSGNLGLPGVPATGASATPPV